MRFVTVYLIGYFALVIGALVALWSGGALHQIGALRLIVAFAVAIGLGLLLAFAAGWPSVVNDDAGEEEG